METTKFSIGGYNFDDWSLVKELYVPENVSSSTAKSLHMRGREELEHHLQHYVIPNDKKFIVFAVTNVKMTTTSGMGLFGTGLGYGRYPEGFQSSGAPELWTSERLEPLPTNYYATATWGTLVVNKIGVVYECILSHNPITANSEPGFGDGEIWKTYWHTHDEVWAADWGSGKWYYFNEHALVTVDDIKGAYMCLVDHESSLGTKPCVAGWDNTWEAGSEFKSDFGLKHKYLSVSAGMKNSFGKEILAVFSGASATLGRRIDAKTTDGTMKAGATIFGIEVDENA